MVGGHASHGADAGELVREQLPVVLLQLVDLLLVVRRDAVHRLGGDAQTQSMEGIRARKRAAHARRRPHQVPGSVGSGQVTLDVGVEDLDGGLDEAAAGEVLVVLDEREPGLQQLVVGLHVDHVVLVQLPKTRTGR